MLVQHHSILATFIAVQVSLSLPGKRAADGQQHNQPCHTRKAAHGIDEANLLGALREDQR